MHSIFENIKQIAYDIDQAIKHEDLGYSNNCNATGDIQLKLDVACDAVIEHIFADSTIVKALISEEKEEIFPINPNGKYTVCYDPLDGSSIVDVNLSVGSIFGIYEGEKPCGNNLVAAAYIIYGPRLEMITAIKGEEPKHYRCDKDGMFNELCKIQLEQKGKPNAPGGTQKKWLPHHKKLIESLFAEGYRLRYSGGMVPDLHQILLKGGGLFSYPATTDNPAGKLRLLFEVLPFALIFEAAGGGAIDDKGARLLELTPEHIHGTSPCFFGSVYEIEQTRKAYGAVQ